MKTTSHRANAPTLLCMAFALFVLILGACVSENSSLPRIGVMQHQPATWADEVRAGFLDELATQQKLPQRDFILETSYGTGDAASLSAIARTYVTKETALIFAISTQAAQAAIRAADGRIPVLFGAITDPVTAGLVTSLEVPGGTATGTSDQWPVRQQLLLFQELNPSFARLGVVHNPGEDNSVSNMLVVTREVRSLGWELQALPAGSTTDVYRAAQQLASTADGLYIPASNTVLQATEAILQAARPRQLPVIAGVTDSVRRGAHATYSVSYYDIGRINGRQAVQILWNKVPIADLPVEVPSHYDLVVNNLSLQSSGLAIPERWLEEAAEIIRE